MGGTPTRASMLVPKRKQATSATKPKTKRISLPQVPTGSAGPHAPNPRWAPPPPPRGVDPVGTQQPPPPPAPRLPIPGPPPRTSGGWWDPDTGGWGGDQSHPRVRQTPAQGHGWWN